MLACVREPFPAVYPCGPAKKWNPSLSGGKGGAWHNNQRHVLVGERYRQLLHSHASNGLGIGKKVVDAKSGGSNFVSRFTCTETNKKSSTLWFVEQTGPSFSNTHARTRECPQIALRRLHPLGTVCGLISQPLFSSSVRRNNAGTAARTILPADNPFLSSTLRDGTSPLLKIHSRPHKNSTVYPFLFNRQQVFFSHLIMLTFLFVIDNSPLPTNIVLTRAIFHALLCVVCNTTKKCANEHPENVRQIGKKCTKSCMV